MTGSIADNAPLQRRAEPLTAELDGEIVMLDPDRGSYFSLAGVASRVWELLEDPMSLGQLCEQLPREFDIDAQTCRQEVRAFIQQLLDAELVVELPE